MAELEVDLTKAELTEPQRHKEKVRKVFWHLLDVCCGVTEEDIQKRVPNTDHLEYSDDLHDPEQFIDLLFFKELRQLLKTCGVVDFSFKDLHFPMPKRFRIHLSAIINMAKFREEQLRIYAELAEPRSECLVILEEKHTEHAELSKLLEQAQADADIQMAEYDEVAAQCQELESEIARSNKLQASKREDAAQLKKEANAIKDELATCSWTLQELQAEEEGLKLQVVSSPDRRKRDLEAKKQVLDQLKAEARKMQQDIADGKTMSTRMQQAVDDLKKTIVLQNQVLEEAGKYKDVDLQLQECMQDVRSTDDKTAELDEKTNEEERSLLRLEEKLTHMRKQAKMKMDAVLDRIDIGNEQLLIVERERREAKARVEAGESHVKTLKSQMDAEQQERERELRSIIDQFHVLERTFHERNEKRMAAVEAA
jgi:kinetochore protein Nuf2